MHKIHALSALLSIGLVHCAVPDDTAGMSAPSVPVHPVLDLPGLAREAVDWCAAIIGAVDQSGQDGTAKLNSASQAFGESIADNIDSLEQRAGVLSDILNAPGVDFIEHEVIKRAVTFGGAELAALLHRTVQTVFDALRSIGHI